MESSASISETARRFADIDSIAPVKGHEAQKRIRQLVAELRDVREKLELSNARIELLESERDVLRYKLAIEGNHVRATGSKSGRSTTTAAR